MRDGDGPTVHGLGVVNSDWQAAVLRRARNSEILLAALEHNEPMRDTH
jgi:hypothetical protein